MKIRLDFKEICFRENKKTMELRFSYKRIHLNDMKIKFVCMDSEPKITVAHHLVPIFSIIGLKKNRFYPL